MQYNRATGRYRTELSIPLVHSERSRRSVRYWGAKLWNSIPALIRNANTETKFAQLYEAHLKSKVNSFDDSYDLYDFV